MKNKLSLLLVIFLFLTSLCGCAEKTKLDPENPVTLTMWHVYGEQADSPMNRLIEEFNSTVGQEKGIIINVSLMSNTAQIGEKLLTAQKNEAGALEMPDLFFCHTSSAEELGASNLLNWKDVLSEKELENYVPEFLEDGMIGNSLSVFPVSKSTHFLFISGTRFERFSKATGVTYDSLSTWDGFFKAAEKYYKYSGGEPFCAIDYLIRAVELNALEKGATEFYTDDGWYDFSNEELKNSYYEFAKAISKGYIIVSDLYSNTQVMTGEVVAGLGSSASVLYYNDTVTYPDNTSEPMDLTILSMPNATSSNKLVTQAGVGLCAYKTTEQKAEAAAVFASWLTESERNLEFCVETGYMPVNTASFDKIKDYKFSSTQYERLYKVINEVNETATAVKEPSFAGYYNKVNTLYTNLREQQKSLPKRFKNGESENKLAAELWELFKNTK